MGQNVTGHVTHIAQMNWGILRADWDDPSVAEFVENLDRVNRIAMRSPGFVWMMPEEEMDAAQNDAEGVFGGNPRTASTLSVWETPQALDHFVHNTVHASFMARSEEWQVPQKARQYVIWPTLAGHRPTLKEAKVRLDGLSANGPSPEAYDFPYLRRRLSRTEAA